MNCKQFQQQISSAVDKRLVRHAMERFLEHAGKCTPCRFEYESESATKSMIQRRVRVVRAPETLMQMIGAQLDQQYSLPSPAPHRLQFLRTTFIRPAIAFAAACVVVVFVVTDRVSENGVMQAGFAANDVILQSLSNYGSIVDGTIKPQLVSSQTEPLEQFFSGKTDFPVLFPKMKDCKLVGGVVNEYFGSKLAHVVYSHHSEVVYMYQTCWETVMKGEPLHLSDSAKRALETTGWFSETRDDGRTVVVWKKDRTLCAAVARMSKEDLITCLTDGEPGSRLGW